MSAIIPLASQLAEVRREIAYRERVYPRWVENGKIKAAAAQWHLECMRAVERTLAAMMPPEPEQEGLPLAEPTPERF